MREAQRNPFTLHFASPDLEASFREGYAQASLKQVRWALLLGIALYGVLFGAVDAIDAPQALHVIWAVRLGVCLVAAGVYVATFSGPFTRYMQPALGLVMLLGGLGLVAMLALDETGPQYFDGPALVVLAAYAVVRLRFVYATAVGWLTTAAYAVVVLAVRDVDADFAVSSIWFVVSANVIGMFAAYEIEAAARKVFLQTEAISAQAGALARRNDELVRALARLESAQSSLVLSEKMASLGRMTAGVAHEIKNPLNFITNFATLSQQLVGEVEAELSDKAPLRVLEVRPVVDPLLGDLAHNSQKIAEHGRRADGVVRKMLEHASARTGARAPVDLNRLVEGQLAAARTEADASGVALVSDPDPDVGAVTVLPKEIGRVVRNLLENALDAVRERAEQEGPDYRPRVSVATLRTPGGVEIRVSDNGPGIPEDRRALIFEPFYTTKPSGEGTGLGLSLAYEVVTLGHAGAVLCESDDGHGTTIVVCLPLAPAGAGVPEA